MSNSDENKILVYDEENDEQVEMHKISINDKDKAFLQCLYEADGYLTTMEIGKITGIDRNLVHYRYDKFGRDRYTEVIDVRDVDSEQLPRRLEQMKEAKLTDKGRELIEAGLIGDLDEDHISEEIVLTKEEFEEYRDELTELQEVVTAQATKIDGLEQELATVQKDVSSFKDWKVRINTFVFAARSAFKSLNVKFGQHLKKAKKEVEQRDSK